ncbi:MAG: ATP-binding cassette domain-containing protein [Acidimicrobiales bacterium]
MGESGSGKSTIARAVLRLIPIDAGVIRLGDDDLTRLGRAEMRQARRHAQMVFQDPYSSLDPSMVVADIVGESLGVHDRTRSRADRHRRVGELLDQVGMSRRHLQRYPYEFSGGQRQRIAIARAIATNPKLVVCDEAVSALDVSTQNQIINLLEDLQHELGIAYLFISHGLAVVRHISRRVVVLYLGQVMESGPTERIFAAPSHPYTRALLSAVPVADPDRQRERRRIILTGDPPDPTNLPPGCPFAGRCPEVIDRCLTSRPALTPVDGGGEVACHLRAG